MSRYSPSNICIRFLLVLRTIGQVARRVEFQGVFIYLRVEMDVGGCIEGEGASGDHLVAHACRDVAAADVLAEGGTWKPGCMLELAARV
jgi:hypothetical protein